jgi:release factor glutamine methyltransferase
VTVLAGDLLGPVPEELRGHLDAVVSNPPYIPSADIPGLAEEVVGYEPHLALDGGEDGLAIYRRILSDSREWLRAGGLLAVELDERTVESAAKEAQEWYEEVRVVTDLAGRDRVLLARRR